MFDRQRASVTKRLQPFFLNCSAHSSANLPNICSALTSSTAFLFLFDVVATAGGGCHVPCCRGQIGGPGGWALCYVNRNGLPLAQLSSLGHHKMLANIGKQPRTFTSRREGLVGASPTTVGVAATSCPPGHAYFVASIVRRGSVRPKDSMGAAGTQSE
jgi:hypothetical protein